MSVRERWKRYLEGEDPAPGYEDTDRPIWLDIASLRFEHSDGYMSGWQVGFATGIIACFIVSLIWTVVL